MAVDFTVVGNVASIKRRAIIPSSQLLYQDTDIRAMMSEELQSDIVPLLMQVKEDYFLTNYDQAIDTSVSEYAIPYRAIGGKLKDVVLLNSSGQEVSLPRVNPDQLKHGHGRNLGHVSQFRAGFFFQDDSVIISPDPSELGQYQIRMKYFRRPNNLVGTSSCGKITIIDTATGKITLDHMPNTWVITDTFDVVKGKPGFKSLLDDETPTVLDVTTQEITFDTPLPTRLEVGDWVCISGEAPLVQIPYEVHKLLEQRVVVKIMEGLGDTTGLQAAADVYKDMKDKFTTLVTPRADDSPKRLVSNNYLWR